MRQLTAHPAQRRIFTAATGSVAALDARPPEDAVQHGTALLVPGYTGSKEDFAPVLAPLAERGLRVVAMDQPGQYESAGPEHRSAYGTALLAETVLEVIAALGDGPVHLLGHSFGGLVVRAAAITAPDRLRSLVLLDSGPAAINGARRQRMEMLEPLLASGGMPAVYEATEQLARSEPGWVPDPPALRDFLRERFLASSPHGLAGMGDALRGEPDRVVELRGTGLPVLVGYGEDDDAWTPAEQRQMAERLGAERVVIPGAAHSPAIEQPAATVAALAGFWLGQARRDGGGS